MLPFVAPWPVQFSRIVSTCTWLGELTLVSAKTTAGATSATPSIDVRKRRPRRPRLLGMFVSTFPECADRDCVDAWEAVVRLLRSLGLGRSEARRDRALGAVLLIAIKPMTAVSIRMTAVSRPPIRNFGLNKRPLS